MFVGLYEGNWGSVPSFPTKDHWLPGRKVQISGLHDKDWRATSGGTYEVDTLTQGFFYAETGRDRNAMVRRLWESRF